MPFKSNDRKPQILLAALSMTSGIALVIAVIFNTSLGLLLCLLGSFAGFTFALKWSRTSPQKKPFIKQRFLVGILSGAIATLGYDISRLLVVKFGRMPISPFETFNIFGQLIVGEHFPRFVTLSVGTAYHLFNGVMFGVAYCFILGKRGWQYGVIWALFLEVAMFSLYPGWLNLEAVLREFTIMSVSGHIVYGAILGWLCRRLLKRSRKTLTSPSTTESSPSREEHNQ